VTVPPYCLSRGGKVFRLLRSSQFVAPNRMRFALRAVPITSTGVDCGLEAMREFDASSVLDKVTNHQAIPTPEETFEQLWQQLQQEVDLKYA
jgi:hypothetical protein